MAYNSFIFQTGNHALLDLSKHLLSSGREVHSRAGDTRESIGVNFTIMNPLIRGFVLPHRKANLAAQIAETMWVLSGRNDVEWLARYLPRAPEFSDDGVKWRGGYGPRLRDWNDGWKGGGDQIAWVIDLLKKDPETRRAVLVIFDPDRDQEVDSKDIPCNNLLHFLCREGKLHLFVTTRSNDLVWGWSGINFFEWSSLLEIVAGMAGLQVGQIHFSISSLHFYTRHTEKVKKMARPFGTIPQVPSPGFEAPEGGFKGLEKLIWEWFDAEYHLRSGHLDDGRADYFPEPMLRSWLQVIRWWWSGEDKDLEPLRGTMLFKAAKAGLQPPERASSEQSEQSKEAKTTLFQDYVSKLHATKHAAYGDSWKKRGETYSILPNIARKVDRLGKTDDLESAADTAIDLLVYLIKYSIWQNGTLGGLNEVAAVDRDLRAMEAGQYDWPRLIPAIQASFDDLIDSVERGDRSCRDRYTKLLLKRTYSLAAHEWWKLQNKDRKWAGYGDE